MSLDTEKWSLSFVENHLVDIQQKLLDELVRFGAPNYMLELIYALGYFIFYQQIRLKGEKWVEAESDFPYWLRTSLNAIEAVDSTVRPNWSSSPSRTKLPIPTENDILEIVKQGENQVYEFKSSLAEVTRMTKEIGAMLNSSQGGVILYGIEDDGVVSGTNLSKQQLDQRLNNSIKNSIAPAAVVQVEAVNIADVQILVILVPGWDGQNVFQYDGRIYLRKGTNAMVAKPEEVRALHQGNFVV